MIKPNEHGAGSIRSVARAFRLLRLLNERQGTGLHDLHLLSGLPKPTVFRLLLTLQEEGFVEPDGMPGVYRLTPKVLELSAGYVEKSLIVKIAAPIALAATKRIKWPLAIGTLDGDAMVVRYSSMPNSALGVQTTTLGHRLALLETAMGRAYLGACSPDVRRNLASAAHRGSSLTPQDLEVELKSLEAVAAQGYGVRYPRSRGDSATLAVPILHVGEAMAALSLTTFGNLMDGALIERLLPVLRETAWEIETTYAARLDPAPQPISTPDPSGIPSA